MNMHVFYYHLKIWFEDEVRLLQVGGERVGGGDLLPFLHLHHRQEDSRPLHLYHWQQDLCTSTTDGLCISIIDGEWIYTSSIRARTHNLCTSTIGSRTHDLCTSTTNGLCISIIDGEWIYTSSIRARGIIDLESIQMSYVLDLHGQPLQEQISNIFCIMFDEM
ncbi:hypothetical protein Taro_036709 [Colocasia esculenta]|uniref:Uncharacterized protein n=1 Tax=Colocasia esculenta TaxID=4460 RepID=A0A843VYB7_COLES|nr:hypothetical protein [Colocasia esculenta]